MKTILVMGQSNVIGRSSGPLTSGPNVTIWNNATDIDTLSSVGSAFVAPNLSANPFVAGKPSFTTAMGRYLSELIGEPVRLITVSKGGTSIDQWMNAGGMAGAMYARMMAVLAAAGVSKVDGFVWDQGESDLSTMSTYATRLGLLIARMKGDGIVDDCTPIVVGEVGNSFASNAPAMNVLLKSIVGASSQMALARVGQCYMNLSDNGHFDGNAVARVGLEFARMFSTLPGPWCGTWATDQTPDYVFATGGACVVPNATDTGVPLYYNTGNEALLDGGKFVASKEGVWRFDYRAHSQAGRLRGKLLNGVTGGELDFGTYSGSYDNIANNPMLSGFSYLRLWRGDSIALAVSQSSGGSVPFRHEYAERLVSLAATFVGP